MTGGPNAAPGPPLYALKDADTFVVCNAAGDIEGESDGLFHNDTRVLSRLRLNIDGARPTVLSTGRSKDSVFLTSHLVDNPLTPSSEHHKLPGAVHIKRAKVLWNDRLLERLSCVNYGDIDAQLPLAIHFGADFADIFEVRGTSRFERGALSSPAIGECEVTLSYQGLDEVVRTTTISFSERPDFLTAGEARFHWRLPPRAGRELFIDIGAQVEGPPDAQRFRRAAGLARWNMRKRLRRGAQLKTTGRLFNEWIDRSRADIALLTSELPTGPFPYAGIPWFSTPFGRDSIITGLQTLWLDPGLSRGVLRYLAKTQARETSTFSDSAPGKIMHETRKGEMAALGEVPFGQYYGGVDTTPLYVMLACAYADRTGDEALIEELWPALTAALGWINTNLDANPLGLLVYSRGEKTGLANQGWKDSEDSVFHSDGRMAKSPIALVEVQGYAYAALLGMAGLAERRGDWASAAKWRGGAEALRENVENRFWLEDEGFYGLAVDGDGELCRVRASNQGHLLFVGLPAPERARRVAEQLLSAPFDSGWGVRTVAVGEARYNPMSYHNGTVWPHDTSLCAAGLARYGDRVGAVRLLAEMFEAAMAFDMRQPELFCGFRRASGEPPVAYPVACVPQAWAAGASLMLLQACLGLRIDGWWGEIHIERPHLPIGVDQLVIRDLEVGGQGAPLTFRREGDQVVVTGPQGAPDEISIAIRA
jgi:glycogen debranching enzyme